MTINELIKCVGMPYRQLDENGKALGCMLPIYLLYPEIPRYDWPPEDKFLEYFLAILRKHGKKIELCNIQIGDVVAFHMPLNFLHVGVYCGNDEVIHCITGESLERFRLSMVSRRIEEVFRWDSSLGHKE